MKSTNKIRHEVISETLVCKRTCKWRNHSSLKAYTFPNINNPSMKEKKISYPTFKPFIEKVKSVCQSHV